MTEKPNLHPQHPQILTIPDQTDKTGSIYRAGRTVRRKCDNVLQLVHMNELVLCFRTRGVLLTDEGQEDM